MKKMMSILGGVTIVILALVVYETSQPNYSDIKATWHGGLPGDDRKLEGMTLSQVSAKADELTAIYGEPARFKTEDGRMVYQADIKGYDKSKCLDIHEKAWRGRKLIINQTNKICSLLNDDSVGLSSYPDVIPLPGYPSAFPG